MFPKQQTNKRNCDFCQIPSVFHGGLLPVCGQFLDSVTLLNFLLWLPNHNLSYLIKVLAKGNLCPYFCRNIEKLGIRYLLS